MGVLSILRVGLDNSQLSVFPLTLWGLKESDLPTIFHGLRRGHPWVRTSATFEARRVRRLGSLDRSSEPVVNFSNLEFCPDVWALWTSGDSRPSRISPFSSSRTRSTSRSRGSLRTRGGFDAVRILRLWLQSASQRGVNSNCKLQRREIVQSPTDPLLQSIVII